ncbi:MAG: transporter [Frankiales bacterium]|nr:transporter [Frankiales bacterium]
MILVVLAILASATAGATVEHRWHERSVVVTDRAIQILLYVLMPFITFFVIARLDLHAGVGAGLALAWVEILAVGAIAWVVATRALKLERPAAGTVVVCCMLANTGYLGIPLNAALLGRDAIAPAIAWDVAVSGPMLFTFGFGIAAACGTQAGDTFKERLRAFLTRNPPLIALVAALLVPDAWAPSVLVDIARVSAIALLPVGFFVLGAHLAREQEVGVVTFPPPLTRPVAAILGLRLVVAPALFTLLALSLHGVPDAYRLQAAMPCGINALVAAHTYGLDLRMAASAVAWATAVTVVVAAVAGAVT